MDTTNAYRQELVLYVVWHPDFAEGRCLATFVYDKLTRDSQTPLARGLGIPVYLRTATDSQGVPATIPLDEAAHTVVVLLVDDEMVDGRRQGWEKYVQGILDGTKNGTHRVLPVKLSARSFTLNAQLRNANFLPLDTLAPEARPQRLLIGLVHDLCRLLQGEPALDHGAAEPNAKSAQIAKPVRVFISHAKKDGEARALKIRDYILQSLQLDSFFDRNQIYYAEDFARVLEENVEQSALLVLQTDAYSTREWCQREVLIAKRHGRPVVVLHKVDVGESRSFPYLGNLPVIRYKDEMPLDEIVGRLLLEVLKAEHFPRQVQRLAGMFGKPPADLAPLARTPELLNVAYRQAGKIVVYPDPPLGNHEVELLREFNAACQLATPFFLLTGTPQLRGTLVGLSLSSIAPEAELPDALQKLGFLQAHFDDALSELARFLLASGADLAYGGDLRVGGFTEKLHNLVLLYSDGNTPSGQAGNRVKNFLAWVAHAGKKERLRELSDVDQRLLSAPEDVIAELKMDPKHKGPSPFEAGTPEADYLNARCFTAMREEMNRRVAARVLLGGPLAGYSGRYPGLVEEAFLALGAGLPTYLIGAFGGCTRSIIDALEGRAPQDLTFAGQVALDEAYRRKNPQPAKTPLPQRVEDFNRRAAKTPGIAPIDLAAVLACFTKTGAAGLAEHNGLTVDENRRLFVTPDLHEIIYFVLKGLNQLKRDNRLRLFPEAS